LWKRTQIANNAGGDIFISVHANSTTKSSKISGFETFLLRVGKTEDAIDVAKRENSVIALEDKSYKYTSLSDAKLIVATMAQNADMKASEDLADMIQQNMSKNIQSKDRGVKQAGFHVLIGASMPNVLFEAGFLSNPGEAAQLGKAKYRREISKALYSSVEQFIKKYEKQ
jgi:N-acetylmuramoyl-L-alanine amidase